MSSKSIADGGVRARLRAATRSRHTATGALPPMRRLFAADYTLTEYRAHLARVFGFIEPLEQSAAHVITADVAPYFLARSAALRDDLGAMGCTPPAIEALERCSRLPSLTSAGIRGYLYVMLGSMLGGQQIAQRLSAVLGPRAGLRFYGAGAGESDVRWTRFCSDLEQRGGADLEAICATANATFDALAIWMQSERGVEQP